MNDITQTNRFQHLTYNELLVLLGIFDSFGNGDVCYDLGRMESRIDRNCSPKEDPDSDEYDAEYTPPDSAGALYESLRKELREAYRIAAKKRAESDV